jgi:hypothetical protein
MYVVMGNIHVDGGISISLLVIIAIYMANFLWKVMFNVRLIG